MKLAFAEALLQKEPEEWQFLSQKNKLFSHSE